MGIIALSAFEAEPNHGAAMVVSLPTSHRPNEVPCLYILLQCEVRGRYIADIWPLPRVDQGKPSINYQKRRRHRFK
jgi:hypothetical protein